MAAARGRLRRGLVLVLAAALLTAVAPASRVHGQVGADTAPALQAVPRADCGPGSRPEPGVQGRVPRADRESGRSQQGYSCNVEVLGTHQHGEGAGWQFAWYGDCGYYGTLDTPARVTAPGAVVVDASDPADPVETALLTTPAVNDPHESLKVNQARGLLAAVQRNGPAFDVYDVATDCTQPELLASVELPGTQGHEGEFAPDGRTYYGSNCTSCSWSQVNAIDLDDPTEPRLISSIPIKAHGLSISDDGTRAYLASGRHVAAGGLPGGGLTILDISDIQRRVPNPQVRQVSMLTWADGAIPQHTIPVTIRGRQYLVFVDEALFGAARIIDITDETDPKVVAKLKLEIHLEEHRLHALEDGASGLIQYDGHYCGVDRRDEPSVLACGYAWSGIRVFDIRDPLAPREIAYYIPPAITDRPLPASSQGGGTADRCAAAVRIVPPSVDAGTGQVRAAQLWTQCQDNEFMVLELTNGAWPGPPLPPEEPAPACATGEAQLFAGAGTLLTNGVFFPGTAVHDGAELRGVPLPVGRGCDVRFTNLDAAVVTNVHAIVSFSQRGGRPLFASGPVAGPGAVTMRTGHLEPGVYPYYCSVHHGMYGLLEVGAGLLGRAGARGHPQSMPSALRR